ncbi:hypothetical protein D7W81_24820 [Corallococcus aberystwythensis]|uniref:Uncharacterized protein n=1 Tax=Corallococcus aberystwythensis TaxID=2316722 RepID=A0A3A8Q0K5_9BACT|nr:hypothetical protein D7W81_24820 [Corallococcus aberystwythensis]
MFVLLNTRSASAQKQRQEDQGLRDAALEEQHDDRDDGDHGGLYWRTASPQKWRRNYFWESWHAGF